MSKPVLCIPSYNRPNGKAIERCKNLNIDKFLFIRKSQKSLYAQYSPYYHIILQKDSCSDDIGKVRRNIVNFCDRHHYDWTFVFDDDVLKVETLGRKKDGTMTAQRILEGSKTPPSIEEKALKIWYKTAKEYALSLSSPNHRAHDRFHHGQITLNKSAICACVLLYIPDIISVGNYKSIEVTGNEDYYIQYKLMKKGLRCGKVGLIEFDVPSLGSGKGGCNSEKEELCERYQRYIRKFQTNVCNDPNLVRTKATKVGVPSLQFVWKNWAERIDSGFISIEEGENV